MRLRGWHVEGVGLLHDFRVERLPDGLTVIFGPNEAGKTSLLAFVRGTLFGYPDRRMKDRQYPPLRGGRHGGRLFVESDGSNWIVERFASPTHLSIMQPDGTLGTEAELQRLLGGVDAKLHRNVFAFSLSELQEFGSLQVEGVKDRIFAAGVMGAGRSARSAIKTFADQRIEIGRKRGECRINELRKRADELDEALRQAKARSARHPELRHATEKAEEDQKGIGRALADARREIANLDALLAAWPDWDERRQVEAELMTLGATPDLPDDLGTRLDSSLLAARTQHERLEERQQAVQSWEQQLAVLVPDDRLAAVSGEVKRLAARTGSLHARRERLGEIRTEHDNMHKRVEEEAPRLGAGWTSKSVREFDASIPAAQEIGDWGERLRTAGQELRDADEQTEQLESSAQALADETLRRTEALTESPLPEAQDLNERDDAVRRLRTKFAELVALRADFRAATQHVAEAERRAAEARHSADRKHAEFERRASALRSTPELPNLEDLARHGRAIRELRTGLAELVAARADLRAASQRAFDAKQRADETEFSASAAEAEVERRAQALTAQCPVADAESIAASERAARELRSRLMDLAVLRSDLRSAETRLADRRRDAERRGAPMTTPSLKRPLLVVAAVLFILAVILLLVSQFVGAAVALGTGVLAVILAMRSPVASSATPDDTSIGIAEAERGVQELAGRIERLESSAKPLATRLGFSSLPDQSGLDVRADELAAESQVRQDRDRNAATLGELRAEAQRRREAAQRLGAIASGARAEFDNVVAQRVRELEATNLAVAGSLGFAELPTSSALEAKADDVGDLAERRRERDLDVSAVQALEVESEHARDVAVRLDEDLTALWSDVESSQAARVRAAEESALAVALSLGLPAIPDAADIELKAEDVDKQIRARQERDRESVRVEELRRQAEAAATSARKASEKAASCRRDHDTVHAGWAAWKAGHRCPDSLRPETAQQFFAAVERLRESLAQLDGMDAESAKIAVEIRDFSQAVHCFAEQAGIPLPPEPALAEGVIEGLRERVEADGKLRAERARVVAELEKASKSLAIGERDAIAAANALESVLAEAGASDEQDCRARIMTSRQRADLKKRVRDTERRLRARLGVGTNADAVRGDLASGDCQRWEARKQECKARLAHLQPAHEDALRGHQTAIETLSALERECDIVTLATEREGVVAEIREALTEWRCLAIAQSLVQGTLRRYELERQPAVLKLAAASFSRITAGRYTRLITREDDIDVVAADGNRFDAAALSRGTAEQLYLCLRLALASEFGRLAVQLPLVMDDVLVNFDPERARLAAQVVLDATLSHQVLLFTCHPETVDLLLDLAPNTKVVEIDRATASGRSNETIVQVDSISHDKARRGSAVQGASNADTDLAEAIVNSLRAAGRPLSRSEILAASGLPDARWATAIQSLRVGGRVVSYGSKRGATWGLRAWETKAEASQ